MKKSPFLLVSYRAESYRNNKTLIVFSDNRVKNFLQYFNLYNPALFYHKVKSGH